MKNLLLVLSFILYFSSLNGQSFIAEIFTIGTTTIETSGTGYNYTIKWGDGQIDNGVTGNITHSYSSSGTYVIEISGDFPGLKNGYYIEKVLSWGIIQWETMQNMFAGGCVIEIATTSAPDLSNCTNLSGMFLDGKFAPLGDFSNWNVSNVANFSNMFAGCFNLSNSVGVSNWDVSGATDMSGMFSYMGCFELDLSGWNVSNVANMSGMFRDSDILISGMQVGIDNWDISNVTNMTDFDLDSSVEEYDNALTNWSQLSLQENVVLDISSGYCLSETARTDIINSSNWTINDNGLNCSDYAFEMVWDVTSSEQFITIPTFGSGYNYSVDWGDGNTSNNVSGNITHNYSSPSIKTIKIQGAFPRIYFNNSAVGKDRLLSINDWGLIIWESMESAFNGCTNLEILASDSPNLTMVNSVKAMFKNCSQVNSDFNNWDVSSVTDMSEMFMNATTLDQSFSGWDVSEVLDMTNLFTNVNLSISNYDNTLISWSSQTLQSGIILDANYSKYCIASGQRQNIIDTYSWQINDGGFGCGFVSTWQTTSMNEMITVPTIGSGYNYSINWGDGSPIQSSLSGDAIHTYVNPGYYQIEITGSFPRIYFNNDGNKDNIISIDNWGENQWSSMANAFKGCTNLEVLANDAPNLSSVSSLISMFRDATSFNSDISHWDVSTVIRMEYLFEGAISFNQSLANWNVSNVEKTQGMFEGTISFDQDLSTWNIQNVDNMTDMFKGMQLSTVNYDKLLIAWSNLSVQPNIQFHGGFSTFCTAFQERSDLINLNNWTIIDGGGCGFKATFEISEVDELITIPTFGSGYNYSIDWGDDSGVDTNITGDASHFYASIGTFQITISGDFPRIFFNNSIDANNITSVDQWGAQKWTSMNSAFSGCSNLQILATDAPDLSSAISMIGMFKNASSLNSDINHWDVSNIRRMDLLFKGASAFDQNLDNWNTSKVINMRNMFEGASAFDQDISSWDFNAVANINDMFKNAFLSTINYDNLLSAWACEDGISFNLTFNGGSSKYCLSGAREVLEINKGWSITDDGLDITCGSNIITWTGNDDQNWYNCNNWSSAFIPGVLDNVIIPVTLNDPFIMFNQNITIKTLDVNLGVSFEIENGGQLFCTGN